MRRRSAAIAAAAVVCVPGVAVAAWPAEAAGTATSSADTMTNASGFTAACTARTATSTVTLRWTASPDAYVTGYTIVRTASNGATLSIAVLGRTTATHTDTPLNPSGLSYTYTIRAVAGTLSWQTAAVTASGRPSYTSTKSNVCVTAA